MALSPLPLRRVRKQPKTSPIDWKNPATRGLIYFAIGDLVVDLVSTKRSVKSITNGTITQSVTSRGLGQKFSGANSVKTSRKLMGNGAASILIVANPAQETAGRFLSIQAGGSGDITLATNSDHAGGGGVSGQLAWVWLQSGVERSAVLVPSVIDSNPHNFLLTKSAGVASAFVDGVKKSTSIFGSLNNAPTSAADTYQLGGSDSNSSMSPNCTVVINCIWDRKLGDSEGASVSANPLSLLAPRIRSLFVSTSIGGSALAAAASGSSTAAGTAALAAQVALAGVGVSIASGSAGATAQIPLSAAGIAVAGGTANAQATVTISASGLAQAAGSAGLSASVLLAAAGAATAAGNAALATKLNALAAGAAQASGSANLTGGAPGALSASGQAQASGTAALILSIKLAAAGSAISSGSATLTSGTQGGIAASGHAQASGTAYPTIRISTAATGAAIASGTAAGSLSAGNQITAIGTSSATGSASITVTVAITAAGFVQAMGAGGLSVEAPLSALGQANAAGTANLSLIPDYIPVAPLALVAGISRPTRLHAATQRPVILRHEVTRVYQH